MSRISYRTSLVIASVGIGLLWLTASISSQPAKPAAAPNVEWRHYGGDLKSTRYSPLDQIDASNFSQLEIAWRFRTDNLGPRPEYRLEGTPLMVNGVVYATGGTRRSVVALDAKTGEQLWVHRSPDEGRRAELSPRSLSGRGLSYWSDGRGDDRILYVTIGYQLVAVNARTGATIPTFGNAGIVDLKQGVVSATGQQIDLVTGEIGLHATPTVVRDVVIVGAAMSGEGGGPRPTHNSTKGLVRAFDVRTGKRLWTFNTIPRPGEVGNETWLNDSWATTGNAGAWAQISADEDLGLVYLPIEDPISDVYGGHRPGNNLFGNSLVCVDLKTGQRRWHFQLVHHPIWDLDIPAAPILVDITVNGRPIKAVAQPTKQAILYVFDRVTGQPVWPIEERPVPKGEVPTEWYSPTQPFPTKPPSYARNELRVPDDLIDFTPELRAEALKALERYRLGPLFTPPAAGKMNGILGTVQMANGGSNWPGASYDPETHILYAAAGNSSVSALSVAPTPPGLSDMKYVEGIEGGKIHGLPGDGPDTDAVSRVQGLPIVKPPYGVLTAIDLDRGELRWQVPRGDTPDNVRNHAALKGLNIPKTGQGGTVGSVVTKTLVILGDAQVTTTPEHPRGAMLRAYDKATGKEVGGVGMPAPQSGSPMTYMLDGRQYIIVAVGGGNYVGEYLAFSLPAAESRATAQGPRR